MSLFTNHRWWVWFFFCPCGRFHRFRERDYVPPLNGFEAKHAHDRQGDAVHIPARYSLVCPCERGHFKFKERGAWGISTTGEIA